MLIFVVCAMMTGVDALIDRPRDKWMLFWFPLALLLSFPALIARCGVNSKANNFEQIEP
jgi:hypothetical protein